MLDDDGVGPFDFNMLSDKQSIIRARAISNRRINLTLPRYRRGRA